MLQKYNITSTPTDLRTLGIDKQRFDRFSRRWGGILLDFSRVSMAEAALEEMLELAAKAGIEDHRDRLFSGKIVNQTENRSAMHMALRNPELSRYLDPSHAQQLEDTMAQLFAVADQLHQGSLPDNAGQVTDIIHVGIGGSMLGPKLLYQALPDIGGPRVHFVGSVDAHHREELMRTLNPESTAVVLVSKSFTTPDTLIHGRRLMSWLDHAQPGSASVRTFAIAGSAQAAQSEGIRPENVLHLPEWVGGRYSLWSAVSLSVVASRGVKAFKSFLSGAAEMDNHFQQASPDNNLPVLMALVSFWHRNVCGFPSLGVIPYDQRLELFPAYLQQLIMESNGKSVSADGKSMEYATAPLVFGEIGTDAQHSLFQSMHQGTDTVPLQFIGVINPDHDDEEAHHELLANLLAQCTALAQGRDEESTRVLLGDEASPAMVKQRSFSGNRPSEILLVDRLDANTLGALLALYEHRVFVESAILGINAFDQWGVELGKTLAGDVRSALQGDAEPSPDLEGLIGEVRRRR